ncbi:MAG: DUF1722 domain-containing protein [Kosmotoga sp.]|nr:MAG: DUF1722 domain-containing protein [Kosmotoga sp.]
MREFRRPKVVISRCLGFDSCRYDGQIISSEFVNRLRDYVDCITPCPEVDIGLGIPRDSLRVVKKNNLLRFVQTNTEEDFTDEINEYSKNFLDELEEVDGFILKEGSPSCGFKAVKYYPGIGKVASNSKGPGFFGGTILERFSQFPIENEGRLRNFNIREHFLTRLFLMPEIRELRKSNVIKELVDFQSKNKLMLMAYNQNHMRELGRLVANNDNKPVEELIAKYIDGFLMAISHTPRYTSNINVLMHGLGYFKEDLSTEEKAFFLDSLESYRKSKVPLSVPQYLLKYYIVKYNNDYLKSQTYFEPYPEGLIEITDSGKGR